jgi:hypothetical protein
MHVKVKANQKIILATRARDQVWYALLMMPIGIRILVAKKNS